MPTGNGIPSLLIEEHLIPGPRRNRYLIRALARGHNIPAEEARPYLLRGGDEDLLAFANYIHEKEKHHGIT